LISEANTNQLKQSLWQELCTGVRGLPFKKTSSLGERSKDMLRRRFTTYWAAALVYWFFWIRPTPSRARAPSTPFPLYPPLRGLNNINIKILEVQEVC